MVHEVDEELREIKREIIESRGLVIKTNNLTNALSADIKSIAKRQQTYERRLSWNSATAYVVFVVVVFAARSSAVWRSFSRSCDRDSSSFKRTTSFSRCEFSPFS